jgi:thiamine pyrophosphate-dependent acetolactate synthase large subunit-like protein
MVARYDYLSALATMLKDDTLVVTNLGATFEMWSILRPSDANFYRVNLGQVSAIACGLALALPHRKVVAIDGDGNILLNLSALADIAHMNPSNLTIVVLDNGIYESGGGLPTMTSYNADLQTIAKGCGISHSYKVEDVESFKKYVKEALESESLYFIVAKTEAGRPTLPYVFREDGPEIKYRFVRYIERTEGLKIIDPGYEQKLYKKKR